MKTFSDCWEITRKAALCLGVTLFALNAGANNIVYNNSTGDLTTRFNPGASEVGDEIQLGNLTGIDPIIVTGFQMQYWGLNVGGSASAQVRFYANDGSPYDANTLMPGTMLWDSGVFGIGSTDRATLIWDVNELGGGVQVPDSFTWTVQFSNVGDGTAGVDLYSPPTVGSSYTDCWIKVGDTWQINDSGEANLDFAAIIVAVPEPSMLLWLVGGAGLVLVARRRR